MGDLGIGGNIVTMATPGVIAGPVEGQDFVGDANIVRVPAPVQMESEELAQYVANKGWGDVLLKLSELKPYIVVLWVRFDALKKGEKIMGCRNKSEFCDKCLKRSIRTVQYLVYGRSPERPKRKRPSGPDGVEKDLVPPDSHDGSDSSPALEAFISSPIFSNRKLGGNENIEGPNLATVFVTSNGCEVSSDMNRRSLFIELHLNEERAADRKFKRELTASKLREMGPTILAACWAMVRNWESLGRPPASIINPAFPEWSRTAGGIVEAAGYGCALERVTVSSISAAADTDGEDMSTMVGGMSVGRRYSTSELKAICREEGCFDTLVGMFETDRAKLAAFGCAMKRYDNRMVNGLKFHIEGKGHRRCFWVGDAKDDRVEAQTFPEDV